MLNIYASSFMVATRTEGPELRELPPKGAKRRRRWFPRRPAHTTQESDL